MPSPQRKGIAEIATETAKRSFITEGPVLPRSEPKPEPTRRGRTPTVATTLRFPEDLWRSVRRAAFDNHDRGETPDTSQAIVIEALEAWMRERGQ